MQPKVLLRIGALLMLLHSIGHTFGAIGWTKAPNSKIAIVIQGMMTEQFVFMGRTASLAQFYSGYGISMILVLLFISMQLWLLAGNPYKKMLLLMAIFLSGLVICEYVYFFPLAALFTTLAAVCCWLTLFKINY